MRSRIGIARECLHCETNYICDVVKPRSVAPLHHLRRENPGPVVKELMKPTVVDVGFAVVHSSQKLNVARYSGARRFVAVVCPAVIWIHVMLALPFFVKRRFVSKFHLVAVSTEVCLNGNISPLCQPRTKHDQRDNE